MSALPSLLAILAISTSGVIVGTVDEPGRGWAVAALGLLLLLLSHLRQVGRLAAWLDSDRSAESIPEGGGAWDDLYARLYRHERARGERLAEYERLLARFQLAAQALADGIVILDLGHHIEWSNEAAERLLGIRLDTDSGQPIGHLLRHPDFIEYLAANDYSTALTLRVGNAAERNLSVQVVPFGDTGKLMHVKDVTQIERAEQVRRDFVANVSHELRTPLTVLSGFLETVRDLEPEPAERRRYIDMMSDQAQRMNRIVDDLLTLSSLESSPLPSASHRVPMEPLLAKLRVDAEALSRGRHRVRFDASGAHDLLGSDAELGSAFANLISNAVRYTPHGGEIRVQWTASAEFAEFSVSDTGIGIDPAHIPRLTERFYRVDRSRSRESGGTGLGLAIVKHALMRHQAELTISSEPGKGSRFCVRFPASRLVPAGRMLPEASAA